MEENYAKKLRMIAVYLYQNKNKMLEQLVEKDLKWKIQHVSGNGLPMDMFHYLVLDKTGGQKIQKLDFQETAVNFQVEDVAQVTGEYETVWLQERLEQRQLWEILTIFYKDKVAYLQLQKGSKNVRVHKVKSVNEDCYFLDEDEILYVEANHNHVIWHCDRKEITANDSLQRLEMELSDRFIRIQRGYLVNKDFVKCIRRCEAVMRNGEILPIPSKKYVGIKKKMT